MVHLVQTAINPCQNTESSLLAYLPPFPSSALNVLEYPDPPLANAVHAVGKASLWDEQLVSRCGAGPPGIRQYQ